MHFCSFRCITVEMPRNWLVAIISGNNALIIIWYQIAMNSVCDSIRNLYAKFKKKTTNWKQLQEQFEILNWYTICPIRSEMVEYVGEKCSAQQSTIIRSSHHTRKLNNSKLCVFDLLPPPSLCWTKKIKIRFQYFHSLPFFRFILKIQIDDANDDCIKFISLRNQQQNKNKKI